MPSHSSSSRRSAAPSGHSGRTDGAQAPVGNELVLARQPGPQTEDSDEETVIIPPSEMKFYPAPSEPSDGGYGTQRGGASTRTYSPPPPKHRHTGSTDSYRSTYERRGSRDEDRYARAPSSASKSGYPTHSGSSDKHRGHKERKSSQVEEYHYRDKGNNDLQTVTVEREEKPRKKDKRHSYDRSSHTGQKPKTKTKTIFVFHEGGGSDEIQVEVEK